MLDLSLSQLLDLGGVGSQDRRPARRVGATPRSTYGPTFAEERTLRSNTADVLWFSLRDLWTRVFAGASAAIAARSAHVYDPWSSAGHGSVWLSKMLELARGVNVFSCVAPLYSFCRDGSLESPDIASMYQHGARRSRDARRGYRPRGSQKGCECRTH